MTKDQSKQKNFLLLYSLQFLLVCYHVVVKLCVIFSKMQRKVPKNGEILLTGTFYSNNWINSHLTPLAMSDYCSVVRIVSIYPIQPTEKVQVIYPPEWLRRLIGNVSARLLTFFWAGAKYRPMAVGGFHLLFNGLAAVLLGKCIRASTMYFCVGGPAEIQGGGILSENRVFEKLKSPNAVVEKQLITAVKYFDIVVTMGTRAVNFFQNHNIQSNFYVVSGGIDSKRFSPSFPRQPDIDLITVGRLEPIKRFDTYLRAVAEIKKILPSVKAAIVGEGSLGTDLKKLSEELGLGENVLFPGMQPRVEDWLNRSKLFLLTSDSEGLSLAMMEAMMCGLPAVVSSVGDLGDLVENGKNGFLISERTPEMFATAALKLLLNPEKLEIFSHNAQESAGRYRQAETTIRWDTIMKKLLTLHDLERGEN